MALSPRARSRRRALPPLSQPGWTLLVQGVDLHDERAHALLEQFRFVPQARLDDLMISYATDGGGVGPHFDSYDVFLLQAQGRRRWRIGRQKDLSLRPDVPLKILANFEPEEEYVLEPGDLLYLPPRYAHEGVALGRVPDLLDRLSRARRAANWRVNCCSACPTTRRNAPARRCTATRPSRPPTRRARCRQRLQLFAARCVERGAADPQALDRALGEYLTEPKASVWFEGGAPAPAPAHCAGGGAGPPHPHDVRRTACVHQRRELSGLGPRRAPSCARWPTGGGWAPRNWRAPARPPAP